MIHYQPAYKAGDAAPRIRQFTKDHHDLFLDLIKRLIPALLIVMALSIFFQHKLVADLMYTDAPEQSAQIESKNNDPYKVTRPSREPDTVSNQTLEPTAETAPTDASDAFMQGFKRGLQSNHPVYALNDPYMLGMLLTQLALAYLFAVIAISWHRLILLGPENYQPMDTFNPKKNELEFIGMLALVSFLIPWAFQLLVINPSILGGAGPLVIFILSIGFIYFCYKISFYFPAKAVDAPITIKNSFALTKGYFWKMIICYFLSVWRVLLAFFGVMLVGGFVFGLIIGILSAVLGDVIKENYLIFQQALLSIPLVFYFQPLFTILGVGMLSNYYQHAVQTKSITPQPVKNRT